MNPELDLGNPRQYGIMRFTTKIQHHSNPTTPNPGNLPDVLILHPGVSRRLVFGDPKYPKYVPIKYVKIERACLYYLIPII